MSSRPATALWILLLAAGLAHAAPDPAEVPVQRHILPADALPALLAREPIRLLGWDELTRLLREGLEARRAKPPGPDAPPAPYRFTGLRVVAHQEADGQDARLRLQADVEVHAEGYLQVPLLAGDPTPDRLQVLARPKPQAQALLLRAGSGWSVLLDTPGTWRLELEAWAPVSTQGHLRTLTVQLPPSPGSQAEVDLPGEDLELFMDPAPRARRLEAPAGRTRAQAPIPPGTALQAAWFARDAGLIEAAGESPDAPEDDEGGLRALEPRVFATWSQTLVLGHGRMDARVGLRLEVHRAPVSSLRIRVEGELENLECDRDPRLIERVTSAEDGLVIDLRGGRTGTLDLQLGYRIQQGKPSFEVEVPRLSLEGAWSQRRYLWIGRATNVRIEPRTQGEVLPFGAGDQARFLLQPGASEPLLRYRLAGPDARVSLAVQRYEDAAVTTRIADTLRATTQLTSSGRAHTDARLQVRDRRGVPLRVQLPPGASPRSFWLDGARAHPAQDADGTFRIPLRREGSGPVERELRIEYTQLLEGGALGAWERRRLELLRVDAPIMTLGWELAPPSGSRLSAPRPQGELLGRSLRVERQNVSAGPEDPEGVWVEFTHASPRALELSRLAAILLGLGTGWGVSALLVGALPLGAGLALLLPLALAWFLPDPRGLDLALLAGATAVSFGVLVGLVRIWRYQRELARRRARALAATMKAVAGLRRHLIASIQAVAQGEEPPAPAAVSATAEVDSGDAEGEDLEPKKRRRRKKGGRR